MKTIFDSKPLKSLSLFAFMLLALAFSSCTKDKSSNISTSAYVQVTNSASASLPQDFFLDNSKVTASAVAYGSSSAFLTTTPGDHQGQFKTTGTTVVNATSSLSLTAGKYYSVFYADGGSSTAVQDDRTSPQTGKARIRFINLSSALSSNVDFGAMGGATLASNLAYKAASTYYDVDPATAYSLYATGSTSAILSIPATIQAGHIYTIYVSGTTAATLSFHVINEN